MAGSFVFYHYTPTIAGAIIFTILFFAVTVQHVFQLVRYRAWFMLPVVVGGIFEILAYICRSISHSSPQSLGVFVIQSVLSLVAPALFAATIYMTLGRIIRLLRAEHHSLIRVNKLTTIFVLFDVFSFLIQSAGASSQAEKKQSLIRLGRVLVLAALFIQIFVFGFFVAIAAVFQRRISSQPTSQSTELYWKRHMIGLYIASGLILLRNGIRVVEYIQGYDGHINHHEWFLYVFDAVPMFSVMVVMGFIYAPSLFANAKGEELSEATAELQSNIPK